jgi:hypothetical protein
VLRVPPPEERLASRLAPAGQLHLRLVGQKELPALDGSMKRALDIEELSIHRVQGRGVALEAVPASLVHLVEGHFGGPEQSRRLCDVGRPHGDAEARGDEDLTAGQREGRVESRMNRAGESRGGCVGPDGGQQDAEGVPLEPEGLSPEPSEALGGALEALRRAQEPIACGMAKALVHATKTVDVEQQNHDTAVGRSRRACSTRASKLTRFPRPVSASWPRAWAIRPRRPCATPTRGPQRALHGHEGTDR